MGRVFTVGIAIVALCFFVTLCIAGKALSAMYGEQDPEDKR